MFHQSKSFLAHIRPAMRAASVGAVIAGTLAAGGAAQAGGNCKPVFGPFQSAFAAPDSCEFGAVFCTEGKVIGGLVGNFRLNVFQQFPAGGESPVFFFVGESVITTLPDQSVLIGADTGAIDLDPAGDGHFGTLLRFTSGDGAMQGASGHIVIDGNADFMTGTIMGDYKGEICTS